MDFTPFQSRVQKTTAPQATHMLTFQRHGEKAVCMQGLTLHEDKSSGGGRARKEAGGVAVIKTHVNTLFGSKIHEVMSLDINALNNIEYHFCSSTKTLKAGGDREGREQDTCSFTQVPYGPFVKLVTQEHRTPSALVESRSADTGFSI